MLQEGQMAISNASPPMKAVNIEREW